MSSDGEIREERLGAGDADEVLGAAAPQKGLRIPGPDIRAPGDPATVLDITRRVCDWLRPEHAKILRRIRAAGVVYVDEAGAKVDGRRFWIWVFTTSTDTLVVIRKSRGKKVLGEDLGKGLLGASSSVMVGRVTRASRI